MRATVTVVDARSDGSARNEDVVIDAPGGAALAEVLPALADGAKSAEPWPAELGPAERAVTIDGTPIDPMTPIAASGLRDGAVVTIGNGLRTARAVAARRRPVEGCLELRVVAGPAAGGVHLLRLGTTTIGRGAGSDVRIDDPDVSRRHAAIAVASAGVTVRDLGSTNGTTLDGVEINSSPAALLPGMRLRIGESTLEIAAPDEAPAALAPADDGKLSYNRPPRIDKPDPHAARAKVEFPAKPAEQRPARLPLIATVAPLVAGIMLALVMRRPEYLLFTVLSPLMMAAQWAADRMGHRRAARTQLAKYETAFARSRHQLETALRAEAIRRKQFAPDPASLLKIAVGPSLRLWERRSTDADFAYLRFGCATQPAEVEIVCPDAEKPPPPTVSDVPVTIALRDIGVLGVAGPADRTAALARALVGQLAVLHSPRDLALVLLTEPARAHQWEWIRWLPHIRPVTSGACQALVGLDRASAAARVTELDTLIAARRDASADSSGRTIVVIVDGARALRGTPGLATVLRNGPHTDVLAICLDTTESSLPEECAAVATFSDETATRISLRVARQPESIELVADCASVSWAERLARALAPLRDDTVGSGAKALPDAVRWLDLAGFHDVAATDGLCRQILTNWQHASGGSTSALIGAGADGTFYVDIARDGPHALVAGTTGSGKSELLQTLVASLAVANRPDELTFVLVDYKGGAAFGSCAALPHTVGLVTDLDGSLVERALVSLSAELKRREALLAQAGVANIDGYRRAGYSLARLVIVVDEFASLSEELPDFVGGLVGIAQRGRSLGVHLVLATQRPEGVVSADIRANTNLRICLAVTRDSESRDVIDAPDAARISRTTPGRGYARTGHGELHAFQAGRVGGQAEHDAAGTFDVRQSPFLTLGDPPLARAKTTSNGDGKTDLDLVVDACREAAVRMDVEIPTSPWLPPLPDVVAADLSDCQPLRAVFGMRDVPARQAREPYVIDLRDTGHLVVAGSPRSGRTTGLLTLAGLLAHSTSTADLHMYGIDCAGGALASLATLPQCGAVVAAHETDRARRLVSILTAEITARQTIVAAAGFGSIEEQRTYGESPLPHVAVFIDGWEAFAATFDSVDGVVDGMLTLLRDGAGVGIHVVVTSERAGLVGRLASSVDHRLVLRLADRGDFALIGLPPRAVPQELPAGRGFLADDLTQTHLVLLDPDPHGQAQRRAFARIAERAHERDAPVSRRQRPRRVDPLPARITLAQIESLPQHGSDEIVIGVGGDELDGVRIDLRELGPGFVVAGPPRSGRSTALATIALGLRENGWRVVAVTPRASEVSAAVNTSLDVHAPDAGSALLADDHPFAVLVDDAELVADTAIAGTLDRLMRSARDAGHLVVVAGSAEELCVGFRGFVVDARRCRAGLLLTPRSPLDGEVLGVRLPRDTGSRLPPGRALLVAHGQTTPIQVAVPG